MRKLFMIMLMMTSVSVFSQKKEVTIMEENYNFSCGAKNAITVIIPESQKEVVNKVLLKEIKSWGGKMKASKTEITTLQSVDKKLFDAKAFDSYSKIYQSGQDVKVTVAIDLGGAFLSSAMHPDQFNQIKERLYNFAISAGSASIVADAKAEEKALKTMQKDLKSLEKIDGGFKKNIEKAKKEIEKNEKSISDNNVLIGQKKEEITKQEAKIKEIKATKVK